MTGRQATAHPPLSDDPDSSRTGEALASLVYRSRASGRFDGPALASLVEEARSRNRAEAITGLLVYDEGLFVQWLEGPPAALDRVVGSIRRDPRHGEIEILAEADGGRRTFPAWDMKLATGMGRDGAGEGTATLPRGLLDAFGSSPAACGHLLPLLLADGAALPVDGHGADADDRVRRAVELLVRTRLEGWFPGLKTLFERARVSRTAGDLARLMVAGREDDAHDLLLAECASGDPFRSCACLLEPAAGALGDLWTREECSEFDVTASLCRLQTELRRLSAHWPLPWQSPGTGRSVLVVSAPGEWDCFGPALASEALWRAGLAVDLAFPRTEAELIGKVSAYPFDAVHLSLSPAFRRDDRLARLQRTVADVRAAAHRPDLRVWVGGRVFREDHGAAGFVGADAGPAAAELPSDVLSGLH